MKYDFAIVGGGILGLATAWQLQQRYPGKKLILLEKESALARHQTGHNSGVVHAGVYYEPGSLKANFCKQGLVDTINFCKTNHIPYEQPGKLLVATNNIENEHMRGLFKRCVENGIESELLNKSELKQREPNANGMGAIHVPATGIVDYQQICRRMGEILQEGNVEIKCNSAVLAIEENDSEVLLQTAHEKIETNFLVCCAGLQADRMVKLHGLHCDFKIIPFRGEYYQLPVEKSNLVKHLIYPIPDPALPFLGVHLTRMIDGSITVGPNAVLGWKREGYGVFNFNVSDALTMLSFPGFWKLLGNHFSYGINEMKDSIFKQGYLKQVQKYCAHINMEDLQPYPAGIRAQAVLKDGRLVHDFLFSESNRALHVCNAPSPAATSAIPIANYLCDKVGEKN